MGLIRIRFPEGVSSGPVDLRPDKDGTLTVDTDEYPTIAGFCDRQGWQYVEVGDEPAQAAPATVDPAPDLATLKVDELKALAADENVDLTGVSAKADIVSAIVEHRKAAAAANSGD